jgi:CheY-like chemotaxis protein
MAISAFGGQWSIRLIHRAEKLLRQLAQAEAFHARATAEALVRSHDAVDTPLRALEEAPDLHDPKRALLRAALRDRRVALQRHAAEQGARGAHADGGPLTVLGLLRQDRQRVERTCDGLRYALVALDERDAESVALESLMVSGFLALAGQLSALLDVRAIAAGFIDPIDAGLLERDRAMWDQTARQLAKVSIGRAVERAVEGRVVAPREQEPSGPLAQRVILLVARDPRALAFLTALTEGLGATTVLAESRDGALELLRWFRVDAVFCAIEHRADPCVGLPSAFRATDDDAQRPLFLAFPAITLLGAAELSDEHGFDAAIQLAGAESDALGALVARAIEARKVEPLLV